MRTIHFIRLGAERVLCGQTGERLSDTTDAFRVTCRNCKRKEAWPFIAAEAIKARSEAIDARPARRVNNPWNGQPITCRYCGGDQFKDAGRSLDTYNHKCAGCGRMSHTMTETGMSA